MARIDETPPSGDLGGKFSQYPPFGYRQPKARVVKPLRARRTTIQRKPRLPWMPVR